MMSWWWNWRSWGSVHSIHKSWTHDREFTRWMECGNSTTYGHWEHSGQRRSWFRCRRPASEV